ncbi:MAG: Gfo/Idh/MocA family oxidoreductase [Armatimonadetes bacterium]|nr:Gfo/Idh/MocA family oxidoreductase [Armatimonadota bacterium]
MDPMTRRDVLKKTGAAAAAVTIAPFAKAVDVATPWKRPVSANDKLVVGLIGCGGMGASNMRTLMQYDDVEFAAVCDVDTSRMPGDIAEIKKKYGRDPQVYKDYRQMLDRKDIDAVIVGTPDHWHALNLIHACQAGKDSYCEKPISHNITEAVAMAAAAKKYGRIVQVGTWQRSTKEFTDALAYVKSGKLGKIVLCRAWISDGTRIGRKKPIAPPSNLDYDMWIGPAKMVPYQDNKVHWNWRWVMNTGGGLTTDWGVHMMDIALLGMSKGIDLVMPTEVSTVGGQFAFKDDDRDAPDTIESIYRFKDPDFVMHWSVNRDHPGKPGHGTEFVSEDGKTVRVWRGGWTVLDADGKELPKEEAPAPESHWRQWVDCVKSRKAPIADVSSIAQTTIVCHLSNAALMSGETVRWDKSKMDIVGKAGKNTMAYRREYRKPYALPKV